MTTQRTTKRKRKAAKTSRVQRFAASLSAAKQSRAKRRSQLTRAPSTANQTTRGRGNRKVKRGSSGHTRRPRTFIGEAWFGAWDSRRTVRAIGLLVVGGALVFLGRWALEAMSESDRFSVAEVEVVGVTRASHDEIVALAGLEPGENLLRIEPDRVEASVSRHPWVRSASVRRVFPRKLRVEVTEYEPTVLVALGHLYYANAQGEIVKRRSVGENEQLPVVTGFTREEIEQGEQKATEALASVIAFVEEYERVLGKDGPAIGELFHDHVMGLSFVPVGEDMRVHVGRRPWQEQLLRYKDVRASLRERGLRATKITLGGDRRPERVVARLASAGH